MSQIPSSARSPIIRDLRSSNGDRPIEQLAQERKITTNVTLNPRESAIDVLPSIHWTELPKSPANALNRDEDSKDNANVQNMIMETSNREIMDDRRPINPNDRSESSLQHQQTSRSYMAASQINAEKSYRNVSSDEFSPPPTRTPHYKTGMTGYQPISPHRKQQNTNKEEFINLTGRKVFLFSLYLQLNEYSDLTCTISFIVPTNLVNLNLIM